MNFEVKNVENVSISDAMKYNFDSNLQNNKIDNEKPLKSEFILKNNETPSFYTEETWIKFKEWFPWLIYTEKRFWCSFCNEAYKKNEGMIISDWIYKKSITPKIESKNQYSISRCRFERHSKTQNHILSLSILNKNNIKINNEWTNLKEKYNWLEGDLSDTRCSICEESYKKHKKSMIITIWTCPELKSKQSMSHFTIEHKLDRHEKCNNHLLAVKLENTVEDPSSPLIHLPNRKSPIKTRFSPNYKQNKNFKNCSTFIDNNYNEELEKSESIINQNQSLKVIDDLQSNLIAKKTRRSLKNLSKLTNSSINRTHSVLVTNTRRKKPSIAIKREISSKHTMINSSFLSSSNLTTFNKIEDINLHVLPLSVRRSRKSAPIKSRKQSDVLPVGISPKQFSTLKSRFQWLLCNNETSFLCEICLNSNVFIQFECDATLSFISRKILSHSHSETHIHNLESRGIHTTRLQLGINQKIDYKQLLNGLDDHTDKKVDVGSWSCPQCKSQFDHQNSLIEHISLCDYQSTDVIRELSCPCNPILYRFNTITKLDLHAVQEHSHKQLFNCYICSVRCNRLLLLYGHMLIHHLIDWDPFGSYIPLVTPPPYVECIFCTKRFVTDSELNNHYCQSQCNRYLQPMVVIDFIQDSVHLLVSNETFENISDQNECKYIEESNDNKSISSENKESNSIRKRSKSKRKLLKVDNVQSFIKKEFIENDKLLLQALTNINDKNESNVNDENSDNTVNKSRIVRKVNRKTRRAKFNHRSKRTNNRKNLFSLKLSELGVKSRNTDIDEVPFEELLHNSQFLAIQKEMVTGLNINLDKTSEVLDNVKIEKQQVETLDVNNPKDSLGGILKEITVENDHQEVLFDNGINEFEETSGKLVINEDENEIDIKINPVDDLPKENVEVSPLNQIKVCVEKIDVKKRSYKKNLSTNIDPIISPENEKRIRVPSEKLKNSVDYADSVKSQKRNRIPSERFKESIEYDEKFVESVTSNGEGITVDLKNITENGNFTEKRRRKRKMSLKKNSSPTKLNISDIMVMRNVPMTINELSGLKKSRRENVERKALKRNDGLKNISKRSHSNKFNKCLGDTHTVGNEKEVKSTKRISIKVKSDNSDNAPNSDVHLAVKNHSSIDDTILAVVSEMTVSSPESVKIKRPIIIQSQLSPPEKIQLSYLPEEECIPAEISFMDRMKKIRQLKKIRTEQQREQMMVVDRTIAEINEKVPDDNNLLTKSEQIKKLLTCEQYSMTDLKNILRNERKKRHLTDIDEYKPSKKTKLDSVQKDKIIFGCEACDLKFNSMKKRDCHVSKEHKKFKLFKCKTCDMGLSTHLALKKHAMKVHPDNISLAVFGKESGADSVVIFQCHFCSSQFPTKYLLNSHISNVHGDNLQKLKCANESIICPIVIDEFLEKIIEANPLTFLQQCQICNEVMNNQFELSIHTIEHERENDSDFEANQFACPKCCRLFFGREGKTYLKDHYNIIHLHKPYPSCDECRTDFTSTWCYYEHKRTVKNCNKRSIEQLSGLLDPYEQLNDPLRLAFVCSRCQTLVAGADAQKRFLKHETECSLQLEDEEDEDSLGVNVAPVDSCV